jgi:ferredoxin
MRLWVDPDKCQGHTLCKLAAPELIHLGEVDGHATAVDEDIDHEREQRARMAVAGCPEQAIVLLTDDAATPTASTRSRPATR